MYILLRFLIIVYKIIDGKINKKTVISYSLFVATMIITGVINRTMSANLFSMGNDMMMIMTEDEMMGMAGSGRLQIWSETLKLIAAHPWFGIGLEGIEVRGLEEIVGNPRPHNEFLQYALFYGIPAGILYFAGCLSVFLHDLKYKDELDGVTITCLVAAFGYLVSSFFGITLFSTTPYLFIMLGLGYHHSTSANEHELCYK